MENDTLYINGLSVTLYLPEQGRAFPAPDFTGIGISIDDDGHSQGELISLRDMSQLMRFMNNAMTILTRESLK